MMSKPKNRRHRRPSRAHRPGTARRFLRRLPKPVERLEAVQHAALYLDEREEEAKRSALALERAAKERLRLALELWDGWLGRLGLMRVRAHEDALRRARAKSTRKPAKRRPATKPGAAATA